MDLSVANRCDGGDMRTYGIDRGAFAVKYRDTEYLATGGYMHQRGETPARQRLSPPVLQE